MDISDQIHQVILAKDIAYKAHEGQFRRDGKTPYIQHPEAVANLVGKNFLAPAVAWLHDVLEDTNVTAKNLKEQGICDEVIDAVVLLTKKPNVEYNDYLAIIKQNPLAKRVKVADMLSNLNDEPTAKQVLKYTHGLQILLL